MRGKVLIVAILVGLCNIPSAQAIAPTQHALSPMKYAKMQMSAKQYSCLKKLWTRESHWNPKARNKVPVYQIRNGKRVALHAFGIAQLLNEKSRDPIIQVNKGLRYVKYRYSTPCKALAWHVRHNWY